MYDNRSPAQSGRRRASHRSASPIRRSGSGAHWKRHGDEFAEEAAVPHAATAPGGGYKNCRLPDCRSIPSPSDLEIMAVFSFVSTNIVGSETFKLLQPDANSLRLAQGHAAGTGHSTIWDHLRGARFIWIASSLRSHMIFGKDKFWCARLGCRALAASFSLV